MCNVSLLQDMMSATCVNMTAKKIGWCLPMEITEMIFLYCTSVDIASKQRLPCVCKDFQLAIKRVLVKLGPAEIYLAPSLKDDLGFQRVPAEYDHHPIMLNVGRIVRKAGEGSGLAMRLHDLLSTPDWKTWYLHLREDREFPGWFVILRVLRYSKPARDSERFMKLTRGVYLRTM